MKTERIPDTVALVASQKLVATDCALCGVAFALPEEFISRRRADGVRFFCPNGHGLSYGEGEAETLRKKLAEEQKTAEFLRNRVEGEVRRHEVTRRQLAARKGQITKMKNRIAAGVCPCCNRYFEDLHRHMTGVHPDYRKEEE